MRKLTALLAAGAVALAPATAFGAPTRTPTPTAQPQTPGQPNASCEDAGVFPGNASQAPGGGSPFIQGDSVAGSHYAGEQAGINDKNPKSVSQYDIACQNQLNRLNH